MSASQELLDRLQERIIALRSEAAALRAGAPAATATDDLVSVTVAPTGQIVALRCTAEAPAAGQRLAGSILRLHAAALEEAGNVRTAAPGVGAPPAPPGAGLGADPARAERVLGARAADDLAAIRTAAEHGPRAGLARTRREPSGAMTDPEGFQQQIRARVAAAAEAAGRQADRISTIEGEDHTDRVTVRVTALGHPVSLTFHPTARGLSADELSRAILDGVRRAHTDARAHVSEIFGGDR